MCTFDAYCRFTTYEDCKDALCRDMAYKEHFHCMDCNFKVFTKKEEMIRYDPAPMFTIETQMFQVSFQNFLVWYKKSSPNTFVF